MFDLLFPKMFLISVTTASSFLSFKQLIIYNSEQALSNINFYITLKTTKSKSKS